LLKIKNNGEILDEIYYKIPGLSACNAQAGKKTPEFIRGDELP